MDYGTLRGIFTVLIFVLFIIIVVWAFGKKRKESFDEIASSILDDDKVKDNKQETNNNV